MRKTKTSFHAGKEVDRTLKAIKYAVSTDSSRPAINLVRLEKEPGGFSLVATDAYMLIYRFFNEDMWPAFQYQVLRHLGVDVGKSIKNGYLALTQFARENTGLPAFANDRAANKVLGRQYPNWRNVIPTEFECKGNPPIFKLKLLNQARLALKAYGLNQHSIIYKPLYNGALGFSAMEIEDLVIGLIPARFDADNFDKSSLNPFLERIKIKKAEVENGKEK